MRILWATDIHLNFVAPARVESFIDKVRNGAPDCLLLGGDIGEADSLLGYLCQMEKALDRPIYFVLGNHDFYRGSIAGVRAAVARLVAQAPHLRWLNAEHAVALSEQTALIGHDSWADGRLGNFAGSSVELNDFYQIEELRRLDKPARLARMQALAEEAVAHFRSVLPEALKRHRRVILLTHVPPFREASWHAGAISGPHWLPFFSCQGVGEVLKAIMLEHPHHVLTVLCGHTHGSGRVDVLPNLTVITGGAVYGDPKPQEPLEVP